MPIKVFIEQLFHPFQVNHHEQSLKKLNQLGGYQIFINQLILQSDSYNFDGANDKKQHFLQYILLYLVSLSLFSKILLYTHNAIDSLQIMSESIGIIFLGVLIVWKKKREQIHINQNRLSSHRISKNKYNVNRNGQDLQVQEHELKQGDYVYISAPQLLQFDAILFEVQKSSSMDQSSYKYILVNQKAVDPSRAETPKYSIKEASDNNQLDPFLFCNSTLQEGSGWAVVCAVGGRNSSKIFSQSVEYRLLGLSKAKNFVRVVKGWIVLPILLLGLEWMSMKEGDHYEVFLQLLSLVASLLLYVEYANENEMLYLIIGYFSELEQGQNYKLKDDKIIYKLQTIDIIAIQQDNFSENINELGQLACQYDIKIITNKTHKKIQNQFAFLAQNIVLKDDISLPIKKRLDLLIKSKFISCSLPYFIQNYLPLLQSMKFTILFIPQQEQMKLLCSNMPKTSDKYKQLDDYIIVKNRNLLLQSFLNLQERSRKMTRLRNSYIGILVNSCIELIIMIMWACKGCIIELNLNLFILYTTRNKSLQLFEDYKSVSCANRTEHKHRWWPLNLALVFYYIFMMQQINRSQDQQYLLFLFLMTNRLFRLEPLHPHSQRRKIKYIKRIGGILCLIIFQACLGYYQKRKWQLKGEWQSVLLFPLIIWLYSTFL